MKYSDPTKLRAYFFGNMYISQIAHGIQAAHVVTKMFNRFGKSSHGDDNRGHEMLYDWADVGVTKILLNGGYQSNLADVHSIFEIVGPQLGLPFAKFHEEAAALNGALTSVGIVVPEEVYNMDPGHVYDWTQPATELGDMGYLRDCTTPDTILAMVRKMQYNFVNRDLREDFMMAALHLTLKSARLA